MCIQFQLILQVKIKYVKILKKQRTKSSLNEIGKLGKKEEEKESSLNQNDY